MADKLAMFVVVATGFTRPVLGISTSKEVFVEDRIFDYDSSAFLCSLGMPSACEAEQKYVNESKSDSLIQLEPNPACIEQGQVVFHHVMKTGGVSIRNFLECNCREERCGIWRDDGHRDLDPYLDNKCPPAVCTTHADYQDVLSEGRCGPHFANAKSFTLLRDPVGRVWSFYNYVRRYYKPFRERSLVSILSRLGHEDLNAGLEEGERCKYCADQLSNHMVRSQFCGLSSSECQAMKHTLPKSSKLYEAMLASRNSLRNMSAIFYFDEFRDFPYHFRAARVLPTPANLALRRATVHCDVTQYNPTNYSAIDTMVKADAATMAMIRQANWADIKLYKWSKTLPSAMSSKLIFEREVPFPRLVGRKPANRTDHAVASKAASPHVQIKAASSHVQIKAADARRARDRFIHSAQGRFPHVRGTSTQRQHQLKRRHR